MAGFDPKDSTSLDLPVPQWEAGLSSDLKGKRVGIPTEYRIDGVPAEIDALWTKGAEWLKAQGAEIVEGSLPSWRVYEDEHAVALLDADATVWQYHAGEHMLEMRVARGLDAIRIPADRGIVGECVRTLAPINVPLPPRNVE